MTALSVQICTVKIPAKGAIQGMPKYPTIQRVDDHPRNNKEQLRKDTAYSFMADGYIQLNILPKKLSQLINGKKCN